MGEKIERESVRETIAQHLWPACCNGLLALPLLQPTLKLTPSPCNRFDYTTEQYSAIFSSKLVHLNLASSLHCGAHPFPSIPSLDRSGSLINHSLGSVAIDLPLRLALVAS